MKIIPLFDRVLLSAIPEQISTAGVYIPRDQAERSQIMTVEAIGSGITEDNQVVEMVVAPGDRVVVSKYAGTEVMADGKKLYILKQCDILAKIS